MLEPHPFSSRYGLCRRFGYDSGDPLRPMLVLGERGSARNGHAYGTGQTPALPSDCIIQRSDHEPTIADGAFPECPKRRICRTQVVLWNLDFPPNPPG